MKKFLTIKNKKAVTRVEPKDIMYVLRDGRRLIVATNEAEYMYYEKMHVATDVCVEDFYRILDRCTVNLKQLKSVDVFRRRLIFNNGDELFLGRDACARMKKVFGEYLDAVAVAEEEAEYL